MQSKLNTLNEAIEFKDVIGQTPSEVVLKALIWRTVNDDEERNNLINGLINSLATFVVNHFEITNDPDSSGEMYLQICESLGEGIRKMSDEYHKMMMKPH